MRSFFKDIFSVGVSKSLIIISGLVTSIIIARVLGPEKNGTISALLVYPSLFMSIGSLGIRQSTTYFLGKNIFTETQIKRAVVQIWFLTSILSLLICFLLIKYLSKSGKDLWWIILAVAPIPFTLFNIYNSGIFLGKNEISSFNKINWIPKFVVLVFTILLVIGLELDITGYLIALIIGPLVISLVLLLKNNFVKIFSCKLDWYIIKKMLSLGLVYALALMVINLNYRIDIILLDYISTSYNTGIYSRGVSVTEYLWQIPMLLSTVVFARSAVSKNDNAFSIKVAQLLRLSFLFIALVSIVLFLCSDFVIVTMFGKEFIDSAAVFNLLLPGVILLSVFKVVNMDLAGKGKPWISMKAMVPALIVNILLNLIFIPNMGANGAALASTISYSLATILFLVFYSKETNMSLLSIIKYKRSDFKPLLDIIKRLKK